MALSLPLLSSSLLLLSAAAVVVVIAATAILTLTCSDSGGCQIFDAPGRIHGAPTGQQCWCSQTHICNWTLIFAHDWRCPCFVVEFRRKISMLVLLPCYYLQQRVRLLSLLRCHASYQCHCDGDEDKKL